MPSNAPVIDSSGNNGTVGGRALGLLYQNPPFHPRGYVNTGPWGRIKHGRIIEANVPDQHSTFSAKKRRRLRFLFNPTEFDVSYDMGSLGMDPLFQPNFDPSNAVPVGTPIGSLSFSLLFDRTYELWDQSYAKLDPYLHGCEVDLAVLKQMLSIEGPLGAGLQLVPNFFNPVYVFFGNQNALSYYGYINAISLTYAHFTINMVPVRASVAMSVALLTTSRGSAEQKALMTGGGFLDPTRVTSAPYQDSSSVPVSGPHHVGGI